MNSRREGSSRSPIVATLLALGVGCAPSPTSEPPPSCVAPGPGRSDCGPTGESCCASLPVPGGAFSRTWVADGGRPSGLADPASVTGFRLDKYLVTVGRYRQFVAAWQEGAGYLPPVGSGKHAHLHGGAGVAHAGSPGSFESGWAPEDHTNLTPTHDSLTCNSDYATWTPEPGEHERLPINCITWWEAYAFCIWDGAFLPSETEHLYAAAGGVEQRLYPWGSSAPTAHKARVAIYDCTYPEGSSTCDGVGNIAPVGTASAGAGRWGHLDLAGELTEWTLDWSAPFQTPCDDCANLAPASGRSVRDGYYGSAEAILQNTYRNSYYPTNRFHTFGFRCARAP